MSNDNSIIASVFMVLMYLSVTCVQAMQHALIGSILIFKRVNLNEMDQFNSCNG